MQQITRKNNPAFSWIDHVVVICGGYCDTEVGPGRVKITKDWFASFLMMCSGVIWLVVVVWYFTTMKRGERSTFLIIATDSFK